VIFQRRVIPGSNEQKGIPMKRSESVKKNIFNPQFRILLVIFILCIIALVSLIFRAVLTGPHLPDAFIEIFGVIIIGVLAYLWTSAMVKEAEAREQREQATARLSQSESHYRTLFESAHDAIWVHNLDGKILSANKATALLTGYSSEELSRMNARDFLSPEGLKTAREVRQRLLEGLLVLQPYEQPLIRRDGTKAVLMLTTNLIYREGRPEAFQNISRDITEEKRMQENLRSYVQQITRAQEEERLRIARELHDSLAQNLIALLHRMDNFLQEQTDLPLEKVKELWSFHEQIKDSLQEIRGLSRDLRPSVLDDVGLLSALHLITRELKTEYGIEANLKVHGVERRFPQEVEVLMFRVAQEALRNAGKHSRATNAEVSINFEDSTTTVIVSDNGAGFTVPEKISDLSRSNKLGLVGMEERVRLLGGTLEIHSEPGKGTSVTVTAPI
jgi:two-component system, NarL family, sensor histidine kinase DegS